MYNHEASSRQSLSLETALEEMQEQLARHQGSVADYQERRDSESREGGRLASRILFFVNNTRYADTVRATLLRYSARRAADPADLGRYLDSIGVLATYDVGRTRQAIEAVTTDVMPDARPELLLAAAPSILKAVTAYAQVEAIAEPKFKKFEQPAKVVDHLVGGFDCPDPSTTTIVAKFIASAL